MKVSSVAVLKQNGKLLLGKRADSGLWDLPGGKADGDESPEQTALRELREEAGIVPETLGYLGAGVPGEDFIVHAFKTTVPDDTRTRSDDPDHDGHKWSWVDVSDGLPKHIADNLHAPKNVTLGLLGLLPRQPEPPPRETSEEESTYLEESVELSKSEAGIELLSGTRSHDDLLPASLRGAHLVVEDRGTRRDVRLLKGGRYLATLGGTVDGDSGVLQFIEVSPELQGRGIPAMLRQAFARLQKTDEGEPTFENLFQHGGFFTGERKAKLIREALSIPDEVKWEALDPENMRNFPMEAAAVFGRHDVDSDYLGRATSAFVSGALGGRINQAMHGPILRALAGNPRLPSNKVMTVGNWLQSSPTYSNAERGQNTAATAGLLHRQDVSPEDFTVLAARAGFKDPGTREHVQQEIDASPERRQAFSNFALANEPNILRDYRLKLTPEQVNEQLGRGFNNPVAKYIFENQPQDLSEQQLKALWDHGPNDLEWTPEKAARLPAEFVKASIGKLAPESWRAMAGIRHPGFSEADVRDLVGEWKSWNAKPPSEAFAAPHIGPEYRRELWGQNSGLEKRDAVGAAPPELVDDFLNTAAPEHIYSAVGGNQNLTSLAARADLGPEFWAKHLQLGTNFAQAVHSWPTILAQLSPKPNPVAAALLPHMTGESGSGLRNGLDWGKASEDLVRGMHGAQQKDPKTTEIGNHPSYPAKRAEIYRGRLMELGLEQPQRLRVQAGANKMRQLRALAEENGGRINDKALKAKGINLGSAGLGRLLDARGDLAAEALDRHMASQPAQDWAHTETQWKGLQRHSAAKQKVFQLNLTPERRRELDAMGLGDFYDKLLTDGGGHPVHGRHGAGWVRYTEKPGGVHIDEIQSDIGHNLVSRLKEYPERARAIGADPEKAKQLVDFMWGGQHPSQVLHEAFLQHLRDQGKQGSEVHLWQLQPKMALSDQDPSKPAPAHMKETYDRQPKKMGYEEGQYGELRAQGAGKLKGAPTWKQILKAEDDRWQEFYGPPAPTEYGHLIELVRDADAVPAAVQQQIMSRWRDFPMAAAALAQRPDVSKDLWKPIFDRAVKSRLLGGPQRFLSALARTPHIGKLLDHEEAGHLMGFFLTNYKDGVGGMPPQFLRDAKLSREELINAGKQMVAASGPDSGANAQHVKFNMASLFQNPHLDAQAHDELWNALTPGLKSRVLQQGVLGHHFFSRYFREDAGKDGSQDANAMRAAENLKPADWRALTAPGQPLNALVTEHAGHLGDIAGMLSDPQVVEHLKPAIKQWSDWEKTGEVSGHRGGAWWNSLSETSLRGLAAEGILPSVPHDQVFDQKLFEAGVRRYPELEVRPGLNKLRQLRDTIEKRPGRQVKPEELGLNLSSMGLGHLKDKQGMLSADRLQQHIDSQEPRRYTHSEGRWEGPQRHSEEPSKVFQLNLTPDAQKEIRRQGLQTAYQKLLDADSHQGLRHPIHHGRGIGWVRYTEKPDGLHIDEIQTDFGHGMGATIKNHGDKEHVKRKLPTADEFQRLSHIFWGNHHPSEVLHEAFHEHLRQRGDQTGDQGKEIHVWGLKPKMELAGQDLSKPPPAHMKETYEKQPQKMGYKPDSYGVLQTQSGAGHGDDDSSLGFNPEGKQGSPTYSTRLRKFDLDVLSYLADTQSLHLEKSMGKRMLGLVAATALHVMPAPAEEKPLPAPAEHQNIKDVFDQAPMTGSSGQTVGVAVPERRWSAEGLHPELHAIAHLESGFGKYLNHAPNPTDFNTAFGALALKPSTAHLTWKASKTLQRLYPGLDQEDLLTHRLKHDVTFYNAVANTHWHQLKSQLGGDPEKAAAAWRYGLSAVQTAPDLTQLDTEGYVDKFRALRAQQTARQVATGSPRTPALDSRTTKSES